MTMKLEGSSQLSKKLKSAAGVEKIRNVVVGYSANYALHVHENMEMAHPNGGQAKFLEQPIRDNQDVYAKTFQDAFQQTKDASQALFMTGLQIQRDSQELVPVRTGHLKNSGFTAYEDEYSG